MFTLLCSQLPIFGVWGNRKSGYQQLSQENEVASYPLTQTFLQQIQNYKAQDKKLLQAVEDDNVTSVNQLLNSNTFGTNVLIAASNIAQTKKNQAMINLISSFLSKKFVQQPKFMVRS
jgi:DNA topoisomerase VI subunit A